MTTITLPLPKPRREALPAGKIACDFCSAKCCRYIALPIETPRKRKDFDVVRWFLLHGQTSIFIEDDTWYLVVHSVCQHLREDNLCGAYETRPEICREYSADKCEYEDDWTYDQYFETPEQLEEYVEARFGRGKGQSIRSPKPEGLPVLKTVR